MRRTSRIYLNDLNPGKAFLLISFIHLYIRVLSYFIEVFWSERNLSETLADKTITDRARSRFNITARLAQCAAKQAKETVRSQHKNPHPRMPEVRNKTVSLDSRFFRIEKFAKSGFDMCLILCSGLPSIIVPFNWTKHTNKFRAKGWTLGSSIRIGLNEKGVWIELIFEKPRPELRTEGKVIGVDRGFNKAIVTSDGQVIGDDLKDQIKKQGKRKKTSHHHIKTELFRRLKQLKLEGVKIIVLEDLRNIKRGKRGTFPRRLNRFLSFWLTARVVRWLEQRCEELGIRIVYVSAYKTSQRCSHCGKIDRKNRRGERFKCVSCGYEADADYNASRNLEYLGLAGVYSLRVLKTSDEEDPSLKEDFSIF